MKLHLPNMLRKALLALIGIAGHTSYSMEIKQWNAMDFTGATAEDDILTLTSSESMVKFDVTPNWQLEDGVSMGLIYVASAGNNWGFNAEGNGDISARYTSGKYTTDNNSADAAVAGVIAQQALVGETENVPSVSLIADFRGTALYAPGSSKVLYSETTLRYTNDTITTLNINNKYISNAYTLETVNSITDGASYLVSNSSGSWKKDFSTSDTVFVYGSELGGGDTGRMKIVSASAFEGKKNVVIGKANQLFIQTWSNDGCRGNITLNQDVYIGSTSKGAALRFGMDNYDVTMSGNIYLVENSTMQGSNPNQHVINFTGTLTDKIAGESGVVETNSVLTLNGGKFNFSGTVDVHGITVNSGIINLSGKVDVDVLSVASGATIGLTGSDLHIKSGVSSISGALISEASGKGLTVGVDSEQTAILSVNRMEMGNISSSGNGHDTLTINEGSLLKVTGSQNTDSGQAFKARSIVLGEWNQKTQLNVYGSMFSKDAVAFTGIKGAEINIGASGVLAVQGLATARSSDTNSVLKLTLNDGGSLILGNEGISASTVNPTINLGAGVVGMYADTTTIGTAISLTSAAGTVFDTTKYAFASDGNSISRNEGAAGNMNISGAISGSGKLVTAGSGSVSITGSMSGFSGLIEVGRNSTLSITSADGIMGVGGTIVNHGTLHLNTNLSASDESVFDLYSLSSDGFASSITRGEYMVAQGGTITLKEGAVIYLGTDDTEGTSLSIKGENHVTFEGAVTGLANDVYYVSSTTATASGITVPEGQTMDHIHVVKAGRLKVDSSVPGILTNTTGNGTLELTTSTTLGNGASTLFKGDLEIASGNRLSLGAVPDTGSTSAAAVDISSLNSVILNGGELVSRGVQMNVNAVTVKKGATGSRLTIFDMADASHHAKIGTLSLDSNLDLYCTWKSNIDIGLLTGSGDMTLWRSYPMAQVTSGNTVNLTIDALSGFTGGMTIGESGKTTNVTINTGKTSPVNFKKLDAKHASTFIFNVQSDTSIGTLTAANGTVNLADGVTLNLGDGTADAPVTHSIGSLNGGAGSKLNLASNATLSSVTSGSGVKLTGSGIYDLGSGNITTQVSGLDSADWTGTVKLSGITNANGLNFKSYGNAASKVELNGVSGWFERSTYNTHVVLTGGGLTMTAYSTSSSFDFNKGISGSGDFIINGTSDSDPKFKIGANADGQTWSGAFKVNQMNSAKSLNLYLAGDGSYFDADSETSGVQMNSAGTLNLYTGNTSSGTTTINGTISNNGGGSLNLTVEGDTAFNKDVTASSVTVNSGKSTMVNSTLTANNVTNKGTIKLGNKATVTGGTMSKVQLSSKGISGAAKDGSKGSVSDAAVQINELAEDASFTIAEMNFSNASISAAKGIKVKLEKITASDTLLTGGGQFQLYAGPQEMTLAEATAEGMNRTLTYSSGLGVSGEGTTLTLNLDVINTVAPDQHGVYDISIVLNGFGEGFVLDETIAGMVKFDPESWLAKALEGVTPIVMQEGTEAIQASNDGPTVTYAAGENVGSLVISIHGLNVPEPTTSTLSLLALAALAARRRRRK